jgi:hypothetical protein
VTPTSVVGATVTFDITDDDDVLDCTYLNRARGSIIVEKITNDGSGSFEFTSDTLGPFTLTTTEPGEAGKDSTTFGDLGPGTYDVAETEPAGWSLVSATCDDGSEPEAIGLSGGETVTCTFVNEPQRGAIEITKTRKFAGATEGDPFNQPHPGVEFTISGGELTEDIEVTTGANGKACVDGLLLSSFAGDYTVTETVPAGYMADGDESKSVTVVAEGDCEGGGARAGVNFSNSPLTDVSIDVTSQDPDATRSTIECVDENDVVVGSVGNPVDPASLDLEDLAIGEYVCTIVIDP